jgi:hypothetical protein
MLCRQSYRKRMEVSMQMLVIIRAIRNLTIDHNVCCSETVVFSRSYTCQVKQRYANTADGN